ncbi:HAD-IC family P-type ATPase [Spiroplasma sp. ald]|uniref:HAD-IC family P-type ATPase n=1 Tax=Spiroplasma sp. ald TaxID=2490849 RepID=UPI0037DD4D46
MILIIYNQNNKATFHFINCLTLCNDAINQKNEQIGDTTEIALIDFTRRFTISEVEYREKYLRVLEVPFDSDRKLMSTVNHVNKHEFVYTKGALDQLLLQCNRIYLNNEIVPLTEEMKEEIQEEALDLSSQALRVLVFAFNQKDQQDIETNLIFLGAVGMIDPPRPEAVEAVRKAHEAGIRVIMITGDHKATALAIAKELRLAVSEANVLSGHQIDNMNNHKLQEKLRDVSVFAIVNPDHKTRIVECLQSMNYVVSMTGDGVNDAPSLSKADIGVAMGITGTDVSKEAANIILQDDNFSTIIRGVEEGRNVYHKIKWVIAFVCIAQLANVLVFIIISVTTKIKPFDSVNILWFNLVIETLMSIPIGLGNNDDGLMLEKPRSKKETFLSIV